MALIIEVKLFYLPIDSCECLPFSNRFRDFHPPLFQIKLIHLLRNQDSRSPLNDLLNTPQFLSFCVVLVLVR